MRKTVGDPHQRKLQARCTAKIKKSVAFSAGVRVRVRVFVCGCAFPFCLLFLTLHCIRGGVACTCRFISAWRFYRWWRYGCVTMCE